MLEGLLIGLTSAFSVTNLAMVIAGCLIGTFIGMLPGLGPMSIIAIMIPVAVTLGDPSAALILHYTSHLYTRPKKTLLGLLNFSAHSFNGCFCSSGNPHTFKSHRFGNLSGQHHSGAPHAIINNIRFFQRLKIYYFCLNFF